MKTIRIPMEELVPLLQLQLEQSGRAQLTVTGYSMLPMLHHCRDTVTLAPVEAPLQKGDVILYRRPGGQYILHRILRCRGSSLQCCGDNQFKKEPVDQSQVLAVVCGFTRKGKHYSVQAPGYRRYVFWYVALHPVRWLYLGPRRLVGWCRALFRRNRKGRR